MVRDGRMAWLLSGRDGSLEEMGRPCPLCGSAGGMPGNGGEGKGGEGSGAGLRILFRAGIGVLEVHKVHDTGP